MDIWGLSVPLCALTCSLVLRGKVGGRGTRGFPHGLGHRALFSWNYYSLEMPLALAPGCRAANRRGDGWNRGQQISMPLAGCPGQIVAFRRFWGCSKHLILGADSSTDGAGGEDGPHGLPPTWGSSPHGPGRTRTVSLSPGRRPRGQAPHLVHLHAALVMPRTQQALNNSFVPKALLRTFHVLARGTLPTAPQGSCRGCPRSVDGETEARRSDLTCPGAPRGVRSSAQTRQDDPKPRGDQDAPLSPQNKA